MILVGFVPSPPRSLSLAHSCWSPPPRPMSCRRAKKVICAERQKMLTETAGFMVFVLSDLHTDYPENMAWVKSISTTKRNKDVLLVAGDVAETFENFAITMELLKDKFKHVFFVPGNHDLWCRREEEKYVDSLEKLESLLDACKQLGVHTDPMVVEGLGIIPLLSWYHEVKEL